DWIPGDPALNADMLAEGHRSLAFDARTGRPKWDLDGAFSRSGVVEATEGWAVLYAVPENGWLPARTAVVDTDTGEEAFSLRSRLGTEPPGCAVGEDGLLVCVHEAGDTFELISVASGEPGVQRSAEIAGLDTDSMSSVRVQAVSGGRIHLAGSRWSEGEDEEKRFAVDRFGALLAEDLPGEVVAAAPDRVAVTAVLAGEDGAEPVEFRRTAEGGTPPRPGERSGGGGSTADRAGAPVRPLHLRLRRPGAGRHRARHGPVRSPRRRPRRRFPGLLGRDRRRV